MKMLSRFNKFAHHMDVYFTNVKQTNLHLKNKQVLLPQ